MAKKTTKKPIRTGGMIWVGDGTEMIQGVPTRDLTADEAAKHRDLILATQTNTGRTLYVMEEAEQAEPLPEPEPDQSGPEEEDK